MAQTASPRPENIQNTARPNMAGWWICCNCQGENNPVLNSGRCTICEHKQCPSCRPA
ncbi:hypothetical protein BDV25DRAFT_151742 [Aspergillus avenaceus]|uniref:RanBP2-type domain-containing protein n=1 Tax=Aspergillus avenaceus TaxID=36643 RepID=A0A5N6U0D3_ASPAV|nr:hypothetical protein BDV25DRAFT_151742 [Aspergillus avenaceus]